MKFSILLLIAALAARLAADDAPKLTEPTAATAEPSERGIYRPTELDALRAILGKTLLVEGTVLAAGANKIETIRFLNFTPNYRDSVSLIFLTNTGSGTFTKEKIAAYVGKKVRVSGTITERNGALQIQIQSFDQIKVLP